MLLLIILGYRWQAMKSTMNLYLEKWVVQVVEAGVQWSEKILPGVRVQDIQSLVQCFRSEHNRIP